MSLADKEIDSATKEVQANAHSSSAAPGAAPTMAPGAPLPQNVTRPHPQYQSQMQNTGMAVGAVTGAIGPGSVGGDMITGGVIGGVVGQRLAQAENHAFYKDQAMQYREGRAAGTIPPPEELYEGDKSSWWSKEGRAQRRAERWERRAKRRDGNGE